jgi:hypothetical protein
MRAVIQQCIADVRYCHYVAQQLAFHEIQLKSFEKLEEPRRHIRAGAHKISEFLRHICTCYSCFASEVTPTAPNRLSHFVELGYKIRAAPSLHLSELIFQISQFFIEKRARNDAQKFSGNVCLFLFVAKSNAKDSKICVYSDPEASECDKEHTQLQKRRSNTQAFVYHEKQSQEAVIGPNR